MRGIVAAPGVVANKDRHLEWWQRTAAGDAHADAFARIRLNLDPESIDLYDYLEMDWFTVPSAKGGASSTARTSTSPGPTATWSR